MPPQTAQFSTHRNPKYWEDSEAFVPERFLDGKAAANPAFSPFGDVRLRSPPHHNPPCAVHQTVHQRAVCCVERHLVPAQDTLCPSSFTASCCVPLTFCLSLLRRAVATASGCALPRQRPRCGIQAAVPGCCTGITELHHLNQHPGTSSNCLVRFVSLERPLLSASACPTCAQIALIRLYQHHTLRLVPGQERLETRTTITMSPKHGVMVTVHPRP